MQTEEEETEGGADAVACDHGWLEGPAVDEDSGEDAEDGDGEHVGDLDAGDLLGGGVEFEGKDGDDGVEREEVSEDGDDLGVPEAAHHGDAHDVAHGERRGELRVDGWLGYRLGWGRVGGSGAHAGYELMVLDPQVKSIKTSRLVITDRAFDECIGDLALTEFGPLVGE